MHGWISKNTSVTVTDPGLNGSGYTISEVGEDTIIDLVFNPTEASKPGHEPAMLSLLALAATNPSATDSSFGTCSFWGCFL